MTGKIDVATIIPFCNSDAHLVSDAIDSIIKQSIPSEIHVVGDCITPMAMKDLAEPYKSVPDMHFYYTIHRSGPYRITNSIVKHHTRCPYIALQDADDISYPTRLEKQVGVLQDVFEHTSAAMHQVDMPGYIGNRHLREPTLLCGVTASNVPMGRFINSTRMIRRTTFVTLNGFVNMFCSGDLCFDNTLRILKVPSYEHKTVLAVRRLHAESLTNNPNSDRQAPMRKECMNILKSHLKAMLREPTIEMAVRFGGLHDAPKIHEVSKVSS